uniref:prepilin-type N-terminal cleavage/methylation domain-containing protein n=1 Tax=Cephaloticoccus sp. TaxID=1985742 RepID=UPI004048F3E3
MPRRSAFTLIEMLLALALLALLSAVLINGMSGFFQSKEARPDDNFWQAVTSARMQALEHEQIVSLQFNQEEKQLVWSSVDSRGTIAMPAQELHFLTPEKSATKLLGGVRIESDTLPRVRFYPDGTCDAFRVEIITDDKRRSILQIDQWTCAPVLVSTPQ